MHIEILAVANYSISWAITQSWKINKISKLIFMFPDFYIHTSTGINSFIRNVLIFGHLIIVN